VLIAFLAFAAQSIMLVTTQLHVGEKSGTAFVVQSNQTTSQLLTANHVVAGGGATYVYPSGPNGPRYTATVLRADPLRDAALLQIPVGGLAPLVLGDPALPTSGTPVAVTGYPTFLSQPSPKPQPAVSPSPPPLPRALRFNELAMVTATGVVDGESENGEGILIDVPIEHGDSGAPIIEPANGRVVGMVLGLAQGYGSTGWISGDGLGDSVSSLESVLDPFAPDPAPKPPEFVAAMADDADTATQTSWSDFGTAAGFTPLTTAQPAKTPLTCDDPKGAPQANALIDESGDAAEMEIEIADCSGETVFDDDVTGVSDDEPNLLRLVDRDVAGFIDTHRNAWLSLLRFGIFVDPAANPYLALMSVERNPFGQLVVGHTFHGGPADVAGVKPGDAIIKIDGRPTRSLADPFVDRLLDQPDVTLLLDRELREFTIRLTLQRYAKLIAGGPVPR